MKRVAASVVASHGREVGTVEVRELELELFYSMASSVGGSGPEHCNCNSQASAAK